MSQQVKFDDLIAAYRRHLHAAIDEAAMLAARLSAVEGERDSLKQQIEAMKKPAETVPDGA